MHSILATLWTNQYHLDSSKQKEELLKKRPAVFLIGQELVPVSIKSEKVMSWVFNGESISKATSDLFFQPTADQGHHQWI